MPAIGECAAGAATDREALDLLADLGRDVDQEPVVAVDRDGDDSCVRACARIVPARSPWQLAQPQFHCGKPHAGG
jgi:hypothetical protein